MILPERVFGSASANRTSSGLATGPISLPMWLRSSFFSSGEGFLPVLSVTKQTNACPFNSSGRPTTAASATDGWLTNALSTSAVPMRCPATLSTSSIRPTIQK